MTIRSFLKLVELPTKAASFLPFLAGTAYALSSTGRFDPLAAGLMLLSLTALDMAVTAINNYMDFRRAVVREGYNYEEHNAMSRDNIPPRTARRAIYSLLGLCAAAGVLLVLQTNLLVLLLGILSFCVGVGYSFGPLPLSRTPLGELISGLFMGFLIFFLSSYIHTHEILTTGLALTPEGPFLGRGLAFTWEAQEVLLPLAVSLPLTAGIGNIMLANNLCDREEDRVHGRRTLPMVIGKRASLVLMFTAYAAAFLAVFLLAVFRLLPLTSFLIPAAGIPVFRLLRQFAAHPDKAQTFPLAVKAFMLTAVSLILAFLLAALISLFPFSSGQAAAPLDQNRRDFFLDTLCTVTVPRGTPEAPVDAVFRRLGEIEERMSAHRPGSEVQKLSGDSPQAEVSPDTFSVIRRAQSIARESSGLFDITIAPLSKLWDFGSPDAAVPPRQEIEARLSLVDYTAVSLNAPNRTVRLEKPEMEIDLGGIAKGYAADEAVRILREDGVDRGIINLGGNIALLGEKASGEPWRVGIQDPREATGSYVGVLESGPAAVVTSGVYERYFETGGRTYHHLLDPRTGYPADNRLLSVSLVADRAVTADGYSTAVFLMGLREGREFVEERPGMEAVFISRDLSIHITSGLEGRFSVTAGEYRLES